VKGEGASHRRGRGFNGQPHDVLDTRARHGEVEQHDASGAFLAFVVHPAGRDDRRVQKTRIDAFQIRVAVRPVDHGVVGGMERDGMPADLDREIWCVGLAGHIDVVKAAAERAARRQGAADPAEDAQVGAIEAERPSKRRVPGYIDVPWAECAGRADLACGIAFVS